MKIAIVLNEKLGPGLLANAAACITSGLFNKEADLLGIEIQGKDITFIPITKIPILILKKQNKAWSELLGRAKKHALKYMLFTKEGQSTTSYEEYIERVNSKDISQIEVVGIGVLGDDKLVSRFSGDLPLLR